MMMDSSMRTETDLSLNEVTKPTPGDVSNLRGILLRSRCNKHFAMYVRNQEVLQIRKNFRQGFLFENCLHASTLILSNSISFSDHAFGDYAAYAVTVHTHISKSPKALQNDIIQAIQEDTCVDDGAVGMSSKENPSERGFPQQILGVLLGGW